MQLTVPASQYTLGRFVYQAPSMEGWRQLANVRSSLSLVYAEQQAEDVIETRFGVAIEVHDIPADAVVPDAAALADTSRKQMVELRKADLVAQSAIEAVPSIDNMFTYRLLVRAPLPDQPDAYEVYYVAMAPDKTQYVVVQCITKSQDYADQLYFMQFYGSLASLKYVPGADGGAASAPAVAPAKPEETKPGAAVDPHAGHNHPPGEGH
ncbi:MAG: hypothetical protein ABR538_04110 [Candidatus Binatia bacterium]